MYIHVHLYTNMCIWSWIKASCACVASISHQKFLVVRVEWMKNATSYNDK